MTRPTRFGLGTLAGLFVCGALAQPAVAQEATAPPLTGTFLQAGFGPGLPPQIPPTGKLTITESDCDPEGVSTISFVASGIATGTYSGTFSEEGTVRFGPLSGEPTPIGPVTSAEIEFQIDSPLGEVEGTKSLDPSPDVFPAFGECDPDRFFVFTGGSFVGGQIRYDAVISTPDGRTCTDRGHTAFVLLDDPQPPDPEDQITIFQEKFFSDAPPECEEARPRRS